MRPLLILFLTAMFALAAASGVLAQGNGAVENRTSLSPFVQSAQPVVREVPRPLPHVGLALPSLQNLALANNPALSEARAQASAARGNWLQVGLRQNPSVGYFAEEVGDDGTAGMNGLLISQQFITANKRQLNREVAAWEVRHAEQRQQMRERQVLNDVRIAFYRALIAQRRVEVAERLTAIASDSATAADKLFKAGEGNRISLLQARTEYQSATITRRNAESAYLGAWRQLATVVGCPQLAPAPLEGDPEGAVEKRNFEQALHQIYSESPELAAACSNVQRARWALERAEAGKYPDIQAQARVMYGSVSTDTMAGLQIQAPVPIFNRNQGRIHEAWSELTAAERAVERLRLDLQNRLADLFRRYDIAHAQADIYTHEIIPNAQDTLDLVNQGYRAGEIDYLTLLTAQRTFTEAKLSQLSALQAAWDASIEIDGLLLVGSLSPLP